MLFENHIQEIITLDREKSIRCLNNGFCKVDISFPLGHTDVLLFRIDAALKW